MTARSEHPKSQLAAAVLKGDRRSLGKAITLVESSQPEDESISDELLSQIMPHAGAALRIGISGPPGVGKSTFIEAAGMELIARGRRIAVLAIDPTSPISGGSILGDKTRMERLSAAEKAFVRPSPSGMTAGGVAYHTRESILLCEAAKYDVVIVETVGVGQSDVTLASMVDVFVILHQPNAGDELQGIKRGVLELADIVCVTKADGESLASATRAKGELERALAFTYSSRGRAPEIYLVSSTTSGGIKGVIDSLLTRESQGKASGTTQRLRTRQAKDWFTDECMDLLRRRLSQASTLELEYRKIQNDVESMRVPASVAARHIVDKILKLGRCSHERPQHSGEGI